MKEEIKLKNKIKTLLIFSAAFLSLAAAGFYFVAGESRFFDGGKESFADTVYYTVTFESNGGEEVAPVTVSRGTSILLPTIYKEGYLFVGWFAASDLSGTAQDWFYIPITSNTLYAKFINSYTVGLFAEGRPLTSLDVPIGEFADLPDISHDGYIFEGWFTDSAYSGFALQLPYKPVKDITLYGKLVKTSVITFEPLDGSDSFSMEVSAESAFMLPRLERDGYIFDGWYTDPGFVNKALWNYTATDDITLYAKWYKWCTITFMDGDVVVDSITTTVGTSILLSDVLSNRLDFDGWFPSRDFDGSPTDRFYIAWGDAVFYARWIALYTVDFDSDGGTPAPSKTVRADAYIDLPATAKSGYAFDGWYETQSFAGSALTSPYRPTRDITLYAKWTELYVVTFNANGGVTPPSQTVRADTAGITLPTTTRSGYDFDGWFASSALDGSVLTSPYTPTGNITLYAAWKNTVTFNSNGGSSINSQTVREGASITLPTTTRSGYDFDGWFTSSAFDGTALTSPYTPTGNITLYAAWKNTVTFDSNGGSSASSQTVREGASITLPTTTRSGYDFDGWFTSSAFDGTALTSPYTPTGNITLYAAWKNTVTFNSNGGSSVSPQTVRAGSSIILPTTTRSGYTFDGWFASSAFDGTALTSPYTPTGNITLYAAWKNTVTFNSNGGSSINSQTVREGASITLPTPTRSGYDFDGWFTSSAFDGTALTSPYTPTGNITLYAAWKNTVTFNSNGGSSVSSQTVRAGSSITLPTPTRSGYTFDGWFASSAFDGTALTSPYTPTGNITLYAAWKNTVTFNSNGGSSVSPQTVREGASVTLSTPTRGTYTFDGWFTSSAFAGTALTSPYTPTGNITLYAAWKSTVTFDSNGGSSASSQTVRAGSSITLPTTTKSGYDFDGWFTSSALTSSALTSPYTPTGNITLYAKWTALYTVAFNAMGGSSVSSQTVRAGSSITLPTTTRSGYAFDGWVTSSSGTGTVLPTTYTPTASITLYAKWTVLYTVTFNSNGGSSVSSQTVRAGASITLITPSKANNEFDGWFTSTALTGTALTSPYTPTASITLYAKWMVLYTVAFDSMGGSAVGSQTVRADRSIELPPTVRTGYAFDGWFTSSNYTGTAVTSPYQPTGSLTLYAKWTELYTVTFDSTGGSGVASQNVRAGSSIAKPGDPSWANRRFDGWYESSAYSGSAVTFPYTPTRDITLYAKWTFYYTVIFDKNGGTGNIPDQIVYEGQSASLPTHPTKTSSVFLGWGLTSSADYPELFPWVPTGTASQKTLYARWATETEFKSTTYYANAMANSVFSKNVRVVDIAMLGAHDAFTHSISKDSPWNPVDPNYLDNKNNIFFKWFEGTVKSQTTTYSKAQSLGAYDLAGNGVRLFDVRLVYTNGTWYTEHGLISDTFESYLKGVLQFMSNYPRELIVLDIQRIYTNGSNLSALYSFISGVSYNGRTLFDYIPYNVSSKPLGSLTYGDAVTDKAGAVLLIAGYSNLKAYDRNAGVRAAWANTDNMNTLVNAINTEYNTVNNNFASYSNLFRINQAQRTPQISWTDVMGGVFGSSYSLLEMGTDTNNALLNQANLTNGTWFNVLPVMWVDAVGGAAFHAGVMPVIHKSNLKKSNNA